MKKTIFSNGYEDIYKGKRDVKAGWMLVLPDGFTMYGHSRDVETANKTARATASQHAKIIVPTAVELAHPAMLRFWYKFANVQNFGELKNWLAEQKQERLNFINDCKIEVVEVQGEATSVQKER